MLILKTLIEHYEQFLSSYRDPRISDKFLMGTPLTIIWITILYWLFIKKIGPKLMENRAPFELRTPMLIYNALQVLANIYIIYTITNISFTHPLYKDWSCMRYDRNSKDMRDVMGAYIYALLKVADYMDTIFMVLRKRYNQITFLHVYHHILMAICAAVYVPTYGCGHPFIIGYMNCYVHAIMYAYYFMSAFSSKLKESLWWKKHLTQIQILQFVIIVLHMLRAIFHKSCDQPRFVLYFSTAQAVIMIILFSNFYYKTYIKKSKSKSNKKSL